MTCFIVTIPKFTFHGNSSGNYMSVGVDIAPKVNFTSLEEVHRKIT